ncbi:MAG: hypothetical protein PPFGHCPK_01237 [Spiroplasma endosymbiont of Drosophila atripex]|nr:MAG: hypothetical protein PPFGHCPK_01237 [Spiroplasma endosymbiont of Drosophila atripex]
MERMIKMDIKLINKWEVIIKLIIYSQAIKEYQEYFNILQELEKERITRLEDLENKKQEIIEKINNKQLVIPIITALLNCWRRNKIQDFDFLIKKLKVKTPHNNMRKVWRNVWKEILTYYCDGDLTKTINSKEFKEWQDKFIENCESLIEKWKGKEKYKLILDTCKKLCEIVKSLVSDVCSDHEFQRSESLNIIGNNIFLQANIAKENESTDLSNNNWKEEIRRDSNHLMPKTEKPCWRRYVIRR